MCLSSVIYLHSHSYRGRYEGFLEPSVPPSASLVLCRTTLLSVQYPAQGLWTSTCHAMLFGLPHVHSPFIIHIYIYNYMYIILYFTYFGNSNNNCKYLSC